MTWAVPDWWIVVLLAIATYRAWRILAEDTVLDPVRDRVAPAESKRAEFLSCPFCFGWWLSLAAWLAWVWQPHWTLVAATPLALSALVGLIGARLDPD